VITDECVTSPDTIPEWDTDEESINLGVEIDRPTVFSIITRENGDILLRGFCSRLATDVKKNRNRSKKLEPGIDHFGGAFDRLAVLDFNSNVMFVKVDIGELPVYKITTSFR